MGYFIIGIVLILFIYILLFYNGLVKTQNMVKEAFATMDVYLKKRWDLIPSLVEILKGYTQYESDILEKIAKCRNDQYDKMTKEDKLDNNEKISSELSKVVMLAENYPDLKASNNFLNLTQQLSIIEDEIANSRKYYNAVVRKMNTKVEIFPNSIIAKMFSFKKSKMFGIESEEKNNVKVEL